VICVKYTDAATTRLANCSDWVTLLYNRATFSQTNFQFETISGGTPSNPQTDKNCPPYVKWDRVGGIDVWTQLTRRTKLQGATVVPPESVPYVPPGRVTIEGTLTRPHSPAH